MNEHQPNDKDNHREHESAQTDPADYTGRHSEASSSAYPVAARAAFDRLIAQDAAAGRSLPDTTPDSLERLFTTCYAGSFPSLDQASYALAGRSAIEKAVDELIDRYPAALAVRLDTELLYDVMRLRWDIVTDPDGTVHLFEK
ncbi:MAG: hypothetical protein FWD74_00650 [Actinomycetia bacterium]|nr:hypothetical protein [Actinomycetes bacterium]